MANAGDIIRFYDFNKNIKDCYAEGVVMGLFVKDGHTFLRIAVENDIFGGEESLKKRDMIHVMNNDTRIDILRRAPWNL